MQTRVSTEERNAVSAVETTFRRTLGKRTTEEPKVLAIIKNAVAQYRKRKRIHIDREDTEDIIQQVYCQVLERYRDYGSVDIPTVYVIAHRRIADCVDYRLNRIPCMARLGLDPDEIGKDDPIEIEEDYEPWMNIPPREDTGSIPEWMLNQLPSAALKRTAFVLGRVGSPTAAAEILNISERTIYRHIAKLREVFYLFRPIGA